MERSFLKPGQSNLSRALQKEIFRLGDKGAADEEIKLAIEQTLAESRAQTYRDVIAVIRTYKGTAHGMDQAVTALSGMIRSERRLYKIGDSE